jgi:hypothetical protein
MILRTEMTSIKLDKSYLKFVNLGVKGLVDDIEDRDELHGQQPGGDGVEVLNLTVQFLVNF